MTVLREGRETWLRVKSADRRSQKAAAAMSGLGGRRGGATCRYRNQERVNRVEIWTVLNKFRWSKLLIIDAGYGSPLLEQFAPIRI
jgi:hypothetical protein